MQTKIRLFGLPSIEVDGRLSRLTQSKKSIALLAYLVDQQTPQSREVVADLVWDATSTKQSLHRLRELLTRIRPVLVDLKTTRKMIWLEPEPDTEIDFLVWRAAHDAQSIDALNGALGQVRGEFLQGFSLPDVPQFDQWLRVAREQIRLDVQRGYQRLAEMCVTQKSWQLGEQVARRWLTIDPLDESAYELGVHSLIASHQLPAARQLYRHGVAYISDELGIDAAFVLAELYTKFETALRGDRRSVNLATPATAGLSLGQLPHQSCVPYLRNLTFAGRQFVLEQMVNHLAASAQSGAVALAITGSGGMGKTQTAVEFCYRYGYLFTEGVFWLNFGEAQNVPDEIARIGGERGMALFRDAEKLTLADRVGRVQKAWQDGGKRLLVFDNCENESLLQQWMPVTGSCAVLLTSRNEIWSPNLGLTVLSLTELELGESVELLQQAAPRLNGAEAADIATAVGRLPLALHLAGSFLARYKQISAEAYLRQLGDKMILEHPSLLGHGLTYSPTDHDLSLVQTFAASWVQFDLNDPVDLTAVEILSTLVCLAPHEPVHDQLWQQILFGDTAQEMPTLLRVADAKARLLELGLARLVDQQRMILHRLIYAYVRQQIQGRLPMMRQRVWAYLLHVFDTEWKQILYMDQSPAPLAHARFATDEALQHGAAEGGLMANYLGRFFLETFRMEESELYYKKARQIQEEIAPESLDLAVVLTGLGLLYTRLYRFAESEQCFMRANEICLSLFGESHVRTARSYNSLGLLYSRMGRGLLAHELYLKSLSIYKELDALDAPFYSHVMLNTSINLNRLGRGAEAVEHVEWVYQSRTETFGPDHLSTLIAQGSLGWARLQYGDYVVAEDLLGTVLELGQTVLGQARLLLARLRLAICQVNLKNRPLFDIATELDRCIAELLDAQGERHMNVVLALAWRGEVARQQQDYSVSLDRLHRAREICRKLGHDQGVLAHCCELLADTYMSLHDWAQAKTMIDEAMVGWAQQKEEQSMRRAKTLLRLGEWHLLQGHESGAAEILEEARQIFSQYYLPAERDYERLNRILLGKIG